MHKIIAMFALLFVSAFTQFVNAQSADSAATAISVPVHGINAETGKPKLTGIIQTGFGVPNDNIPIHGFGQITGYYDRYSAGFLTLPYMSGFFGRYDLLHDAFGTARFDVGAGWAKGPALTATYESNPFRTFKRATTFRVNGIVRYAKETVLSDLTFGGVTIPNALAEEKWRPGAIFTGQLAIRDVKILKNLPAVTVVPNLALGYTGGKVRWGIGAAVEVDLFTNKAISIPKLGKVNFGKAKEDIAKAKEAAKQATPAVKGALAGKQFQLQNLKSFTLDGMAFTVSKTEKIPSVPTARKIVTSTGDYFLQIEGETVTVRPWGGIANTYTITKRADDGSTIEAANGGSAAVLRFK